MRNRKNKTIFGSTDVKIMVHDLGCDMQEDQFQQLAKELEDHYRKSTQNIIHFDQLKDCSRMDIEKYRDAYDSMFDVNGAVSSYTIGFNFSINDAEFPQDDIPEGTPEYIKEMIETFKPIQIWSGTKYMQEKIEDMGFSSQYFPYFQDGGFMVLLKTPVFRKKTVSNEES